MKPTIAITMGDSAGIGPEIILKTFLQDEPDYANLFVIGDLEILRIVSEKLHYDTVTLNGISDIADARWEKGMINVWDMKLLQSQDFVPGQVSKASGDAAFKYIIESIRLAQEEIIDAVVTGPINKEALQLAGHKYAGHTEIFGAYTQTREYAMLLYDSKFSVIHVSTHIPLLQAIESLKTGRIETVIKLANESIQKILGRKPRIAVAGLNPHAGENGLFGRQEIEIIGPAIKNMKEAGYDVTGPHAPDTVFLHALKGRFDVVVAMYHDQGHIPMKLLSFDSGVNVSVGMPVIRTSVDHGTAFDIAWQGIAGHDSLLKAIFLACKLAGD